MASVRDTFSDIAAILIPWPEEDDAPDTAIYDHMCEQALQQRQQEAERMRFGWEEDDQDPVLSSVNAARAKMLAAEQELRRLLAYARECTHPRPYTLADLATAAGMSISGIRTSYDQEEIDYVTAALDTPHAGEEHAR